MQGKEIKLDMNNPVIAQAVRELREASRQIDWCECDGDEPSAHQRGNAWICDYCNLVCQIG